MHNAIRSMLVMTVMMLISILVACSPAMQRNLEDGYQVGDLSAATSENVQAILDEYCGADANRRQALRVLYLGITGHPFPVNVCAVADVIGADQ